MNRAERVREVIRAEDRVRDLPRAPLARASVRYEKIRKVRKNPQPNIYTPQSGSCDFVIKMT
jgi:hypothetical protein